MGQQLHVLAQPFGVEPLDGVNDTGVQRTPPLLEQRAVRHLVRERMLERVLRIWKEPSLVKELGGLELSEAAAQRAFILAGDCVKKGERHILANHRSGLKQAFVLGREPVDAGGDNRLRGGGDLRGVYGAREPIRAALSGEGARRAQLHPQLAEP